MNSGDTAWVLVSAALVLFMTPGLALFYGGMVRSKSVLAMLLQNVATIAVISLVWGLVGWTLAFGPDAGGHGLLGTLHFAGLAHPQAPVPGFGAVHVPGPALVAFEMMFAVITTALLTGAGADRMRLPGFLVFAALWCLLVYVPLAHWIFSPNGWLAQRGVLDFAGGTVVETNSGVAALALALVLGRRRGWPRQQQPPHSLPLTLLGAGILWFGWFGFNAGSALAANSIAAQALVTTQLGGSAGMIGWLAIERIRHGRFTLLGGVSGAVAGLVAVTPACGFVSGWAAVVIGLAGGAASAAAVELKFRLGYDDSLDVLGVHGVGGIVGTLAVGLFATASVNPAVHHAGLLVGGGLHQLGVQALALSVTIVWSFTVTYALARLVSRFVGLRVDPDAETEGLDSSQHAEVAYDMGAVGAGSHLGSI
jgi:Amt family ammonium transporter